MTAIPEYSIQTMKVPATVIQELERISRQFFWDDEEKKRKLHTLSWEILCKPKTFGDLGIRRMKEKSQALLTKLA